MKELIDVFRMNELSRKVRAGIIIRLGGAINNRYGMNLTEGLVYELVSILDPENAILSEKHYIETYIRSGGIIKP